MHAGCPPRPLLSDLLASRAALPALALLALLLPVRSLQQAIFAAGLVLALITFSLWGQLLGRSALRLHLPPWTSIYLGQFALLAAAAVAMPLNGLAARWLGMSLPLPALILPPTLALAALRLRRPLPAARVDVLALLGLGSAALVFAIYSSHLSALGLDIHQHIAWVRQIVGRGYVPLAEPGTRILADYPRSFHVLTALWNAAAPGAPAGPFAKAMPFLQNALPLLAIAEQLVAAGAARPGASRRGREVALGLAFFVYAFLVVPMVYPVTDLLGTPRFSSDGILLLPVALVVVARVGNAPRASAAALLTAPLLAAWSLTWNPIVLVLLAVVTGPMLASFWVVLRPPRLREVPLRWRASIVAACGAVALLTVAQDPWVLGLAVRKVPAVRALAHRGGLLAFDEAVEAGLATARDKSVRNLPATPPCHDIRCVLARAADAAGAALLVPWRSAAEAASDASRIARDPSSLPGLKDAFKGSFLIRPASIADYAGLPLFLFVAAGILVGAWHSLRRRAIADETRLLFASLAGLIGAAIGLAWAAGLAAALNDQSHESVILAGYLGVAGAHVSLAFLWLPFAGATLAMAAPLLRARDAAAGAAPSLRARMLGGIGLAIWLALPLLGRLNLHRPLQHRGFWTRIGIEDLRALRRVETAIPVADGVIIPAEHANIAQWEHWVLPLGETTALLPYGERRYLFNVYLGASYPLSWRDLDGGLCSRDPAVRAAFLERNRARWVLIRDPGGADAASVVNQPWPRICGVSFAALGAELPPVREERGIFLFRLRAPRIEAQQPAR